VNRTSLVLETLSKACKQLLAAEEAVLGRENSALLNGMCQDALFLLLAGVIFTRLLPPVFELFLPGPNVAVFVHEGLYYVGVIAFVVRTARRLVAWVRTGNA